MSGGSSISNKMAISFQSSATRAGASCWSPGRRAGFIVLRDECLANTRKGMHAQRPTPADQGLHLDT